MTFHTGTVTSQIPSAASMSNIPQELGVCVRGCKPFFVRRTSVLRDVTQQSFIYLFIYCIFNSVSIPRCFVVELMNCKVC
jgi:hypothetical protein